jgi:hypothetical protein
MKPFKLYYPVRGHRGLYVNSRIVASELRRALCGMATTTQIPLDKLNNVSASGFYLKNRRVRVDSLLFLCYSYCNLKRKFISVPVRIQVNQPVRMTRGIRLDNIEAMLFDFEGTLVDFQWQLSAAVAETLEMLWNMGFAQDRVRSRRYSTLMTEAMQVAAEIGLSPDQVQEQIGCVYDRYDEDALTRWALRPAVKDFLKAIKAKGIRTGLVSNVGGKTLAKALSTRCPES